MIRFLLFAMLFCHVAGFSQSIYPLVQGDIPDALVGPVQTYDQEGFLLYRDGADLFTEAGFNSLVVQEVAWEGARVTMEIFQMASPDAAFSVYSLQLVKCGFRDTIAAFDCITKYQYLAVHGDLFLSLTSEEGTAMMMDRLIVAAKKIMEKNPREVYRLPEPFNSHRFRAAEKNLVSIMGITGLQNSLLPWQEIFLGVRFRMLATSFLKPDNEIFFARIIFETPADRQRFLELAGLFRDGIPLPNNDNNDGIYREFKQVDDQIIYFLQSQVPWPVDELLNP